MFANARVLILAVLTAAGLLAASGSAQAQHRRVYGGVYHGGYVPSYYHDYAPYYYYGGYAPSYYPTHSYVYPAAGFYTGGVVPAYYQPYTWHAGSVYTPSYYGSYYHVGPAYYPAAGYYRGYIIRH